MRTPLALLIGLGLTVTLGAAAPTHAGATPPTETDSAEIADGIPDDLQAPAEQKRRSLREQAVADVLTGKRETEEINGATVVNMGDKVPTSGGQFKSGGERRVDQYVELENERTARIFVILAEFSDVRATDIDERYGDIDTDPSIPGPVRFDGPRHNEMPEPDRRVNNSTMWEPDYSREYFEDLYFAEGDDVESVKTYYEKQSSGRFTVEGRVTDWVRVKYNMARYGRSNGFPCAESICMNIQELVKDAVDAWTESQRAQGKSDEEIAADLAEFDQWDRFDHDGDGDFNEPDGYIDHFQIVHAGEGQADGNPIQGEDAPWSHRWSAFWDKKYGDGPAYNPQGGVPVGQTGLWIADYTMQSENDGMSTTAHEFAHDLGLPDLYAFRGQNAVNWWSLMAQNRARADGDQGIGTRAADFGAWEKLQLGWLDYEIVPAGVSKTIHLGPHEYNSDKPQALVSVLPDKEVVTELLPPVQGEHQWWSGSGNDLDNTMTRRVDVPDYGPELRFRAQYDIEQEDDTTAYDRASVEIDDGTGFRAIPGSITKGTANEIFGTSDGWVDASFDLSAFAGTSVDLRLRYRTDGSVAGNDDVVANDGLFVDEIALVGHKIDPVFTDDAESGSDGWATRGFQIVGATVTNLHDHFYLASNRTRVSYDRYLQHGPYHFGYRNTLPDKVDFFPYQEGLLVSYWDTSQDNNTTADHIGQGLVLPIDSRPDPIYNMEGEAWRSTIQTYDAPFSMRKAESFTIHHNSKPSYVRGQPAVPLFDDTKSYWREEIPEVGVKLPGVGVTMRILKQDGTSMSVRVGTK